MSFRTKNKIKMNLPKTTKKSIDLQTEKIEDDTDTARTRSINLKNQNLFGDEDHISSLKTQINTEYTSAPQPILKLHKLGEPTSPPLTSTIDSQPVREERLNSCDERYEHEEENNQMYPLPESKSPSVSERGPLRRQDSNPIVVRDFNQIEKNLDGFAQDSECSSPIISPDRSNPIYHFNNSSLIPSKFAPDHSKKNSHVTFSPNTTKKKIHNFSKVAPSTEESKMDPTSTEETDARKKWNKLSYVFQSVLLFRREEVRSISDPDAIWHEIDSFKLRNRDKPRVWDVSRQDFAREAFEMIRRVQLFCECAAVGSPKHLKIMIELLQTDPKKYILEPDDPMFILNHRNDSGHTPLYIAAKNGNLEVVRFLIEQKANFLVESLAGPKNKKRELCLHAASKWGHASIVEYLLKNCRFEDKTILECVNLAANQSIKNLLRSHTKKNSRSNSEGWKGLIKCFAG